MIGTMARDQYQRYWTITKIKWNECNCSNSGQIYKDDQAKGNNDEHILGKHSKNL